MKSNAPWSVKGIERDARETAKDAAKRKGLTVGEWLNQMIYTAGDPQSSGGEVEGLKLRDIITAIEHLHKQVAQTHAAGAENVGEVTRKIGDVVERVQRLERVKPASGGDSAFAARIEKLEADSNDRERINALKALEKAVGQVAVQFTTAQKMTIERLDASERQLQELAERVDGDGGGDGGGASDLGFVKDAIDGLSARLTRTEKLAREAAAQMQGASGGADPAFVESTDNRLRVLGDEIKRGGDQIRAFEGAIGKLSGQIDAAERRNAEGLQKVMETLAELQGNSGKQTPSGASRKDIDVAVAAAARETDARFEKLQSSLESLTKRLETSSDAPVAVSPEQASPQPAATEPAPAEPDTSAQNAEPGDDVKDQDATGKSPLSSLAAALGFGDKNDADKADADKDRDETASDDVLSAAVKAADEGDRQESDEDPFSFADEIDAALDEVSAGDDAKDDFSFELDDEPRGAVEKDADAEAQALLSEVHDVFGMNPQGGASAAAPGNGEIEPEARDDLDQILSDLDDMTGEVQHDLEAPDTDTAADTPDTDDEAEARARQQAMSLLFGEDNTQADAPDEKSAREEKPEDYLQAARRQARDAAARAEEDKKPRRRKLTPKQKAILVARARKKRLAEARGEINVPVDNIKAAAAKEALQEAAAEPRTEPANEEDDRPSGGFAALLGKLPFMGAKSKPEDTTTPEAPEAEEARLRNGDRAAFETLKATASARPLTLALIVGIFLSLAVLFFMVKDIVFKSPDAANRGGVVATSPVGDAPPAGDNALDVPNVPTVDPRALYSDAMAGLGAAETEAESAAAIAKLREAAALGHPPAQLQLGEFYKTGQGVDVDLGRARTWFRRAANGGNVLAMHRIGIMTARGEGGPADAGEAIGWFELAANRGLVDSQYNLGAIFHPTGEGTPSGVQDAGKAYYWYSLAASNGDEQAKPLAASVASALSTDQKAELDKSIAEWQARTPDAQANEIAPAG